MTTLEYPPGDPPVAPKPTGHKSRPEPERAEARRAGAAAGADSEAAPEADAAKLNESIARVVAKAYGVITENLEQGRSAAARFREGRYSAKELPDDLQKMVSNLINLARELSTTTLDIFEEVLKKSETARPATEETGKLPAFRPGTAAPGRWAVQVPVTVRFEGGAAARTHTASLARPTKPTQPTDIAAAPLAPRAGSAKPIEGVSFATDVSFEGLLVTVTVPDGQEPGFYSGLVHAKAEDLPLGVLTIEVRA